MHCPLLMNHCYYLSLCCLPLPFPLSFLSFTINISCVFLSPPFPPPLPLTAHADSIFEAACELLPQQYITPLPGALLQLPAPT